MKIFIIIILIFLITSCKSYYYMPTMQNVPLFKEKKEIYVSVGVDEQEMGCFQGAYSLTNHIGTQLNYMSRNNYDDYILEGGIGYYFRYKEYLAFETYGGYGYGMVNKNNKNVSLGLNRLYLQPSIGFTSKIIDFVFTLRFTKVNYNLIFDSNISPSYNIDPDLYIMDKHSYFFCEPGFTIRIGYKNFKLQYQYIIANKLNQEVLKYIETNNSFSIVINLPLKNIKKD